MVVRAGEDGVYVDVDAGFDGFVDGGVEVCGEESRFCRGG